jgi:hypothetical protein
LQDWEGTDLWKLWKNGGADGEGDLIRQLAKKATFQYISVNKKWAEKGQHLLGEYIVFESSVVKGIVVLLHHCGEFGVFASAFRRGRLPEAKPELERFCKWGEVPYYIKIITQYWYD